MEYRTYRYTEEEGDDGTLMEMDTSRQRRGKFESRPTPGQQKDFYRFCREQWDRDGVQLSAGEREKAAAADRNE